MASGRGKCAIDNCLDIEQFVTELHQYINGTFNHKIILYIPRTHRSQPLNYLPMSGLFHIENTD